MKKTIRVFGKELKTKEGRTFVKYSYTKDGKKFYDVHFGRQCYVPSLTGYVLFELNSEEVSIQKGKTIINKKKEEVKTNDILWINKLDKATEDVEYNKQLAEKKLKELEEIL